MLITFLNSEFRSLYRLQQICFLRFKVLLPELAICLVESEVDLVEIATISVVTVEEDEALEVEVVMEMTAGRDRPKEVVQGVAEVQDVVELVDLVEEDRVVADNLKLCFLLKFYFLMKKLNKFQQIVCLNIW